VHGPAVARNEIDILNDNQGRLEKTRELHVFTKQTDLGTGDQQCRVSGERSREEMDRVSFSGSRRAVEQEALLHRKPQCAQTLTLLNKAENISLEQIERLAR
jgi:hypothetical protein